MAIRKELIDEVIATSGGSLIGPDGLVKELTKLLVERMLAGEMSHHLGYEKHDLEGSPYKRAVAPLCIPQGDSA